LQEQYVDMMYRAPHEKKTFRKVEHFKIRYFENATFWFFMLLIAAILIWAERQFEINERALETF